MKCEVMHFDDDNNEIVDETFECANENEAQDYIKRYNMSHAGDGNGDYFYREIYVTGMSYSDGTFSRNESPNLFVFDKFCSVDVLFREILGKFKTQYKKLKNENQSTDKIVKRIAFVRKFFANKFVRNGLRFWIDDVWDNITWYGWKKWKGKVNSFKYEFKRAWYFVKNHHDIQETLSLDRHMLDDLKWNLRRLNSESHNISSIFIEEAWNKLYPDKKYEGESSPELDALAIKLQTDTYNDIIRWIDLYRYYLDSWYDDEFKDLKLDNGEIVKPFIVNGTYNKVDYKKMNEESQMYWNKIWDYVKKYGQGMWE